MSIRIAQVWSTDLGIAWSIPFDAALERRGWQVLHISPPGDRAAGALAAGKRWLPLATSRRGVSRRDLLGAAQLARYFRSERLDIVHTHQAKVGVLSRVVAAAARVPIIVHTVHGLTYGADDAAARRALQIAVERVAGWPSDAVLVQSREDGEFLVRSGALPERKVVWVGNGIDLSYFSPDALPAGVRAATRRELGVGDDEVLFLTAGRLVREKGILELVEAAGRARARDRRVRLAIAGEIDREKADAIRPEQLAAARRAGVLVLGDRRDMRALYAAGDVVVLASWREGLPRVLMEGAAMGKPLLASDARGCREIVVPRENGLRVPLRDAPALAAAMEELCADHDLRRRLAEGAAARRGEYDIERVIERVLRVYDELTAAKGRS